MRFGALIALGLVFAAGLGLAGHLIARDTVALPVASVEAADGLAPARTQTASPARRKKKRSARASTTTTTTTSGLTSTTDDRSGRNRGHGGDDNSGSGNSGSGSSGSGSSGSGRDHPEDD